MIISAVSKEYLNNCVTKFRRCFFFCMFWMVFSVYSLMSVYVSKCKVISVSCWSFSISKIFSDRATFWVSVFCFVRYFPCTGYSLFFFLFFFSILVSSFCPSCRSLGDFPFCSWFADSLLFIDYFKNTVHAINLSLYILKLLSPTISFFVFVP